MPQRILRLPEVKTLTGMSRSSIYLRISELLWPRPLPLGRRMVGWPESEIAAINAARIRGESDESIRVLVASLVAARKSVA
jgi:prophage regulatory protein